MFLRLNTPTYTHTQYHTQHSYKWFHLFMVSQECKNLDNVHFEAHSIPCMCMCVCVCLFASVNSAYEFLCCCSVKVYVTAVSIFHLIRMLLFGMATCVVLSSKFNADALSHRRGVVVDNMPGGHFLFNLLTCISTTIISFAFAITTQTSIRKDASRHWSRLSLILCLLEFTRILTCLIYECVHIRKCFWIKPFLFYDITLFVASMAVALRVFISQRRESSLPL